MEKNVDENEDTVADKAVQAGDEPAPCAQTETEGAKNLPDSSESVSSESENAEEGGSGGAKVRKVLGIVLDVVLYAFLALCIFFLVFSLVSKKNDGAGSIFGYEMRIVASSSMEKSENSVDVKQYKIKDIKLRSMVFIKKVPEDEQKAKEWYSKLKVGDVLTFRYVVGSSQETITHRIIEIQATETGYIISLQGDNRGAEGATVSTQTIYTSVEDYPEQSAMYNYVIGKVTGKSTALGYLVYSISKPVGLALIIIVPCCIIIIWQVVRVVSVLGEERKKKAAKRIEEADEKLAEAERLAMAESEERERQAKELEELKRKIAELEGAKSGNGGEDDGA